jgi:pimeloyl-ACP methyl ester carboxylesterase
VLLGSLNVQRVVLRAEGGSAAIGLALAAKLGVQCQAVVLQNPLVLDETERAAFLAALPDLAPHPTGAHLIAAWNWARMKALFWPWLPSNAAAVRKVDAPPPTRLHTEVREIIRCGARYSRLWQDAVDTLGALAALDALSASSTNSANTFARFLRPACPITVQCDDEPERVRITKRVASALNLSTQSSSTPGVITWQKPL